jgi:glycosyltransferase involved in cell wall biosynthesis
MPEPSLNRITACIVCCDEGDRLEPCLRSVQWADEIIVLDLESVDDSAAIAAGAGARVVPHERVPIVEMVRNTVAAHALSDWVLVLDPDERLAPGAAAALRAAAADEMCDAVVIPRTNYDFGHAPSHASQRYEPQLRMYRRSRVCWPQEPNRLPQVAEDRVRRLPNEDSVVITHDRSRTIGEVLQRSVRYAPLQAATMRANGEEFSAAAMGRALWRETRTKLLVPRAWRDGLPGLLRAAVLISFKFNVWVELWQQSGGQRTPDDDASVRRFGRVLAAVAAADDAGRRVLRRVRR